jgi:hypothetical protein
MPGLVPGIHVFDMRYEVVDGRDKPGHDAYAAFFVPSSDWYTPRSNAA